MLLSQAFEDFARAFFRSQEFQRARQQQQRLRLSGKRVEDFARTCCRALCIRARVLRTRNRGPYCNRGRTAPSASVSLNRAAILSRGRACRADQAQADDGYCTECLHVACSPRRELEPTETVLVRRFTSRCNDPTCSALTPYQWCCPGGSSFPLRQEGGF